MDPETRGIGVNIPGAFAEYVRIPAFNIVPLPDDIDDELGAILDYVDQLQKIDTQGVEPLAHPLPIHNVFRDDEPGPSLGVDEALANAPDRQGDFYGVPAVLE